MSASSKSATEPAAGRELLVDELFDQLPISGFYVNFDFTQVRPNRRMADALGISCDIHTVSKLIGQPRIEKLVAELRGAALTARDEARPVTVEFLTPESEVQQKISMRLSPHCDAQGKIIGLIGITIDVSEVQKTREALQDAESRFLAFMDHLPVCVWVKNDQGQHEFLNKAYQERFQIKEWLGKTDAELWSPDLAVNFRVTDQAVAQQGKSLVYEQAVTDAGKNETQWWVHKFPFHDGAGRLLTGGVAVDITERRSLEARLQESEARFMAFLDHSPALAWMKDEQGRYLFMSRSYIELLGLGSKNWRGQTDFDFYPRDFALRATEQDQSVLAEGCAREFIIPAPDTLGRQHEWLMVRFPFNVGDGRSFIGGVATDITERRRAEEAMRLQSLTDELTGLYNRRGFMLLSEQEYRLACRRRLPCALLVLDLDALKQLNDLHGHEAGDRALIAVAEAMRVATRNSDITGRIGGDEFIIFAAACDDAAPIQRRLLAAIKSSNDYGGLRSEVSASVGVVNFVADTSVTLEQMIAEADTRMYAAKRERRQ